MSRHLCLPLQVHLRINVGCIDRNMAQPGTDGVNVDSGTKKVSRGCVAPIYHAKCRESSQRR